MINQLIFEKSHPGRHGYQLPALDVEEFDVESLGLLKRDTELPLPELSEIDVVRHFTNLSKRNFGVDLGFYPLGSCTMKYNPKINEDVAAFSGFADLHPMADTRDSQGILELMYSLTEMLCEITGMKWGTLSPFAGAQGEFTGMKLFKAYFDKKNEKRTKILVPDSAHGTNPASAHLAGFEVVELKSNEKGQVSLEELESVMDNTFAGIMLTNPNTLGIFEAEIMEVAAIVHKHGGLLYYDGANLNAIMGEVRPGDMGFDVIHLNLHKTFSTPHGGGGPGSGPVLVGDRLIEFLPAPRIVKNDDGYILENACEQSMGRVSGFYGNIAVLVRAYTYILSLGGKGLKRVSELAVLNANYLRVKLKDKYFLPFDTLCKHEFVLSASELKEKYGIRALDIAKGLLENGIHPPTVYFPLNVPEALMIEPTETESKETLDHFIDVMTMLYEKAKNDPDYLHNCPYNTEVRRLDEVLAAKKPVVKWSETE